MNENTVKTPPKEIYLVTGLDESDLQEDVSFNSLEGLSWSTSKEFCHDIKYVLADTQFTPAPVSETTGQGEMFERLQQIIDLKENERQKWADMCIKKQARIEELEDEIISLNIKLLK